MNKKIIIYGMIAIGIISFHMYFTRPMSFNEMINIESIEDIRAIDIDTYTRQNLGSRKERLAINEMKDIYKLVYILDKYRYSKKFKFKNLIPGDSMIVQGRTSPFIQIFITCGKSADQMEERHFTIDDNNKITTTYTEDGHWESEYRISGSEEKVYEELSDWLGENLIHRGED